MAGIELDVDESFPARSALNRARRESVSEILKRHASTAPNGGRRARYRTGFEVLDEVLEGGLGRSDLVLVGGAPGVGKTIVTLQWARNLAMGGAHVTYACYEHDEDALFGRLLHLEAGHLPRVEGEAGQLRRSIRSIVSGERSLGAELNGNLHLRAAVSRLESYADRLAIVRANATTGLHELQGFANQSDALFVDYLQKVATADSQRLGKAASATGIAEGLKEIALTEDMVVVAVAAGDRAGLTARRLRMHNLRGAAGLSYEADIIVMLNEKFDSVSKSHTAYDSVRAEFFKQQVVFTIEKNRDGPAPIDVEFRKDFTNFRFDPSGSAVQERLIDNRIFAE